MSIQYHATDIDSGIFNGVFLGKYSMTTECWLFLHKIAIIDVWQGPKCRSSRPEVFCKKVLLKISQNSQDNTCVRVSFLIKLQASAYNFIKKETLVQVFSFEFCEISKNTFS